MALIVKIVAGPQEFVFVLFTTGYQQFFISGVDNMPNNPKANLPPPQRMKTGWYQVLRISD